MRRWTLALILGSLTPLPLLVWLWALRQGLPPVALLLVTLGCALLDLAIAVTAAATSPAD